MKSVRAVGHDEDIVVITNGIQDGHKAQFEDAGAEVLTMEPIDRRCRNKLYYYDLQKMLFWSLPYETVLALDPDCVMERRFDDWDLDELQALVGTKSPLCSAIMLLHSTKEKYGEILDCLANWSFDLVTGWENCGGMPWDFVAAEGSQGFLFYYYGVLRQKFFANSFRGIKHYGGPTKNDDEYRLKLKQILGHDVVWQGFT